jgi:DNA-binding CsgD family transcriptional regulator
MSGAAHRYARRAVDAALAARADYLLGDSADTAPRVLVLLGAPGNGARTTLLRGVAPRLSAAQAQVHGAWQAGAAVQLCASADDLPAAAPVPGTGIRLVMLAAGRLHSLPAWVTSPRPPDVFTLGPLALGELDGFLEARLGGPMDAGSAATLAHAAGFVPAVLAWLLDTLQSIGRLECVDGVWQLHGAVETDILHGQVAARLDAMTTVGRLAAHTIALGEPCSMPAELRGQSRDAVNALEAQGLIEVVAGDRVAFRAPLIADAVRATAPAPLSERVHTRSLDRGPVTPQAMLWALDHARPVPVRAVRAAVERALERRDGSTALRLVDAALALGDQGHTDMEFLAWLHLRGAHGARRVPDPDRAVEHVEAAAAIVMTLPAHSELHLDLAATAAEVRGYVEGDTDAALQALHSCSASGARAVAEIGALEYLQLVTATRLEEAAAVAAHHGGDFRGARQSLRTRARLAGHIALVVEGRPHTALRKTLPVLARQTLSPRAHPEVVAEAQIAYVVAALNSDGPAAFPALARQFEARHEDGYRADVVGFACTRATWAFATGDVASAQRIALPALGTSEHADASGVAPLLTALLAACSALLGDRDSAAVLTSRLSELPPRVSRMTQGARDAHDVVSAFCLQRDGAQLARDRADVHLGRGHLGFASEVLHAAVRFGDADAARSLVLLADELDGKLHRIRVAHASALIAGDAVQLVAAAEEFRRAGLLLHAAEAAQQALLTDGVPASLERRAHSYAARAFSEGLPGHPLLAGAAPDVAAATGKLPLTAREAEVLRLIEAGLSNADIAARLYLSPRTVEGHITRLYRKIGSTRRPPARRLESS